MSDQGEDEGQNGPDERPDIGTDARPRGKAPRNAPQYPDEEQKVAAILERMPPDTRIRLKRVNDLTKKWEIHGILSPVEANTEWLARRFGGGDYRLEILERNERGQEVVKNTAQFVVPGKYIGVGNKGLPGISDDAPTATTTTSAPGERGDRMPTRELLDSAMATRFLELLNRDSRNTGTNWEGVAAMITAAGALVTPLLVPVIERMLDNRGRTDPAIDEIRRELQAMRNQPGPTTGALHDATRGIREVMALVKLVQPGADAEKPSALERAMELLPAAISAMTGRPMPAAEQPPADPAALPAAPSDAPAGITNADGTANWTAIFGAYRDQLLNMASNGWEPDYCAELVTRILPPEYNGLLIEFLQKPAAESLDLIHQAIPELRAFTKWTPDFLTELRGMMLPEADEPPPAKKAKAK